MVATPHRTARSAAIAALVSGLALGLIASPREGSRAAAPLPTPAAGGTRLPNELGMIPILEWHDVTTKSGRYTVSPTEFVRQLETLYINGYRPVPLTDVLNGVVDLPPGMSPVVLTFDDGFPSHAGLSGGEPDPDTVIGMMAKFDREHPGWTSVATFYVYGDRPFADAEPAPLLRWMVNHGHEIGNHTWAHKRLDQMRNGEVSEAVGRMQAQILKWLPGYSVTSISLPFGLFPELRTLAVTGTWEGTRWWNRGVMLVGDGPTPSPHSTAWRPAAIPRIQISELGRWLRWLDTSTDRRYVSDGSPLSVSFPSAMSASAAPAPGFTANPYDSGSGLNPSATDMASETSRTGSSPSARPQAISSE